MLDWNGDPVLDDLGTPVTNPMDESLSFVARAAAVIWLAAAILRPPQQDELK